MVRGSDFPNHQILGFENQKNNRNFLLKPLTYTHLFSQNQGRSNSGWRIMDFFKQKGGLGIANAAKATYTCYNMLVSKVVGDQTGMLAMRY